MKKVLLLMLISCLSLFAENNLNTNELKVDQKVDIQNLVSDLEDGTYSVYIYDYKIGEKKLKPKSEYIVHIKEYKVGQKTIKFD